MIAIHLHNFKKHWLSGSGSGSVPSNGVTEPVCDHESHIKQKYMSVVEMILRWESQIAAEMMSRCVGYLFLGETTRI
jgi:hypothetical protein